MSAKKSKLNMAVGAALVAGTFLSSVAGAAENPFSSEKLTAGYQLADAGNKTSDGKCGGDKKSDAKCGADKKGEAKCGAAKTKDGSCGGDKKKEAKCGADKKKDASCGEVVCAALSQSSVGSIGN